MDPLFEEFDFNEASPNVALDLERAQRDFGIGFPQDYAAFMLAKNGGEGFIGDNYLVLWPLSELVENSREYALPDGLVGFGSNGGGELFAFDKSRSGMPVIMLPAIDPDEENMIEVASNFSHLLSRMATVESLFDPPTGVQ